MPRTEDRSFTYQKRTRENVRERANAQGGGFDRFIKTTFKIYKVRDGKNLIRILPPTWDMVDGKSQASHYGFDIYVNYGIGVDDQSYLSLSRMLAKPDPIAEARRQAEREGNAALAKDLAPTQRILMWVIDRLDEDEGPMLWAAPFTVDKAIASQSLDEDTKDVLYIDDPRNGCDVRFYREGQGMKTKYPGEKIKLMQESPVHEDGAIQKEWLDFVKANPVPECLQYYEYEHIANVFSGQKAPKSDDDEGNERPASRRLRPAVEDEPPPRARQRPEPEDDSHNERPARQAQPARRQPQDEEPEAEAQENESPRESIRERLNRRRNAKPAQDDDEAPY